METIERISVLRSEIKEIVHYLLGVAKYHFGPNVEDYDGFVDELPFFTLHNYLKKAIYENLIVWGYSTGHIDEQEKTELCAIDGISYQDDHWQFKRMVDFSKVACKIEPEEELDAETQKRFDKITSYTKFNLKAFNEYLVQIEDVLMFGDFDVLLMGLYSAFAEEGHSYVIKESDGKYVFTEKEIYEEDPVDFLDTLLNGIIREEEDSYNLWAENVNTRSWPILNDILSAAFWDVKGGFEIYKSAQKSKKARRVVVDEDEGEFVELNRFYICNLITDEEEERIISFLDKVLEVLQAPCFELPLDFVYRVLMDTYKGMYRIYFAEKVIYLTRGKSKVCTVQDFQKDFQVNKTKWPRFVDFYGDAYLPSEKVKEVSEKNNLNIKPLVE